LFVQIDLDIRSIAANSAGLHQSLGFDRIMMGKRLEGRSVKRGKADKDGEQKTEANGE
jgi:hypothetical protein